MVQCQEPRAKTVTHFLVFTCIWQENVAKIPKCQGLRTRGPTQCKSGLGNNMVSRRNHLLYIFQKQFTSTSPVFMRQNTFEKKLAGGKAHWTYFESRRPEPLGCTWTPTTGCFYDKTIISKENLWVDYYLLLKYCRRQYALLPLPGSNDLQNLAPKCKIWTCFGLKLQAKGVQNQ